MTRYVLTVPYEFQRNGKTETRFRRVGAIFGKTSGPSSARRPRGRGRRPFSSRWPGPGKGRRPRRRPPCPARKFRAPSAPVEIATGKHLDSYRKAPR